MLVTNLVLFICACVVMIFSATYLIRNLVKIAKFFKITKFAAAFIIMAIVTSLPELFVGIMSALQKNSVLSFGNVIGANILNLSLITGLIVLIGRGIKIKSEKIQRDVFFMAVFCFLPIVLFLIGKRLSRIDGILLIVVFLIYSYIVIRRKKEKHDVKLKNNMKRQKIFFTILLFIVFLLVLVLSAKFVVQYASLLALDLKLPSIMIGLFLIAFGTTLPELVFGIRAAQMKYGEMALGDQIGTIIANSTLVLGIAAIIYPITAQFAPFLISAIFLFIFASLFVVFMKSGKRIGLREGVTLILTYIIFVFVQLSVSGGVG